jgi:hypothetical protein
MDEWGRKPKESASTYITLKSAGETAKVRIAAAPLRFPTVWPSGNPKGAKPLDEDIVSKFTEGQWMSIMRSPDYEIKETYVLLVIDRLDGNAKVFKVSGAVYGKIRDYAQNPEWGAPSGYDITVTRTEVPGKAYWDVTPSPKSPLLNSEVDKVRALDIAKLVPNALPANVPQPDDIDEMTEPEPLPWEKPLERPKPAFTTEYSDREPAPGTEDEVIEDIGGKPINLDDIPFGK